MVVDENEMIKLEGYDLEKPDVLSTEVEFNVDPAQTEVKLEMEFSKPKLKTQIKIQHVELPKYGTSGTKGLF